MRRLLDLFVMMTLVLGNAHSAATNSLGNPPANQIEPLRDFLEVKRQTGNYAWSVEDVKNAQRLLATDQPPDIRQVGLTQELVQQWLSNAWVDTLRTIYVNDSQGYPTLFIDQARHSEAWQNKTRATITYNAAHSPTQFLSDVWENNVWQSTYRTTIQFNSANQQTEIIGQAWDSRANAWQNEYKKQYSYDSVNNMIEQTFLIWSPANIWENSTKYNYTYLTNGRVGTELQQNWQGGLISSFLRTYIYNTVGDEVELLTQEWQTTAWVNLYKATQIYDVRRNLINQFVQFWDGSMWQFGNQTVWTYDTGNHPTEVVFQSWVDNAWKIIFHRTYAYDANGREIESAYQLLDFISNQLINTSRYTIVYNANNDWIEWIDQSWVNNAWLNTWRTLRVYDPVGIEDDHQPTGLKARLYQNMPNPMRAAATAIRFELPKADQVSVTIYNAAGQVVRTLADNRAFGAGEHTLQWDGRNNADRAVSSGVYFYELRTGDQRITRSLTLVK